MKNLVMIAGGQEYYYDNEKDLIKAIICDNYYNLKDEEKKVELEKRAIANTMLEKIKVIKLEKQKYEENSFIIDDEITHVLSLIKFNKLVLLEKSDYNYFGKYLKNIEKKPNTYIILNKFADEIMKNYLKCKEECKENEYNNLER